MAEHSTLTGANLHEPKGADTATADQVYISDGAGSGTWTDISTLTVSAASTATSATTAGTVGQEYVITGVISDISTAETIYLAVPYAGTVSRVTTVLENAITLADATITPSNSTGAMETITVAFTGSAAGDVDSVDPSTNTTVAANSFVSVATDGGSTTSARLWVSVSITRT